MIDVFHPLVLQQVIANLFQAQSFLLDRYFKIEIRSETESVLVDIQKGGRRIAPLCSPLVPGTVVRSRGFSTNEIKPAYVKDKRIFSPNRALRRVVGEQIGGALSPQDRLAINLRTELADQVDAITRRMEWMAASALANGSILLQGEGYPATLVDFKRDSSLKVVKAAGSRWSDAGVNPLDDLQDWSLRTLLVSGSPLVDILMDVATWKVFRGNSFVQQRWNSFNPNRSDVELSAANIVGGKFMGQIDGFNIFVYVDWFEDPLTGAVQPMLPANTVIGVGDAMGTRAFAAIQDEESGFQAMPFFPKSWVEKDPSARYLLTQSAPLAYPGRPDATFAATVL